MSRLLSLICLTAILASGCASLAARIAVSPTGAPLTATSAAPAATAAAPVATAAEPTAVLTAAPATHAAGDCPVTPAIMDQPPKDPNASPFGLAYWYVNADRTVWAGSLTHGQSWRAGGEKVIWIRPAGADFAITGHRLDAGAPPLRAEIPCCYPTGFQVTGLIFPSEGCWEVTAKAGSNTLRFVTRVAPAEHPAAGGNCASLADVVKLSDAVLVGRVTDVETDGDYSWETVTVVETWKLPAGWSGLGDWISVLQGGRSAPRLEKDGRYVLFLQYAPWQLVCSQQSVVQVRGEQASPLGKNPLWPGGTMVELKKEVDQDQRLAH